MLPLRTIYEYIGDKFTFNRKRFHTRGPQSYATAIYSPTHYLKNKNKLSLLVARLKLRYCVTIIKLFIKKNSTV